MLTLPTDHFSSSQLDTVRMCGERYRFSYIEGIKVPPRGTMLTGSGVHDGAAARHIERMTNDTEMKRGDVVDLSVASFDERLENEGIAEEEGRGKKAVEGECRDQTATLAGGFADLIAPNIPNPIAVEEKFELDVASLGIKFVGFMDVVTDDDGTVTIEDLKTGAKKHGQDAVDSSDQLSWYAMGWQATRGKLPDAVGLRSLRELKAGPKQDLVLGTRTDDHVKKLLRIIDVTCRAISAGVFIPAPPSAWWCSPKWCGYWNRCRYRGGK